MNAVVVDGPTRDKLLAAHGVIEIRDEAGDVLGQFTKVTRTDERRVEGEWPDNEELDRRTREDRRFSAGEVTARLRAIIDGG